MLKRLAALAAACISLSACVPAPSGLTGQAGAISVAASEEGASAGRSTTKYNAENAPRSHNLALAASAINGALINPGETFSYNAALGPTTKERGYQKAKVFQNGLEKKNYGGGVCQVSSTLYNAALSLGLEIVERHPHSRKVDYVPEGKDAATSFGKLDLRFTNNTPRPLLIEAAAANGEVAVSLISP